jgi:hypothetical protein
MVLLAYAAPPCILFAAVLVAVIRADKRDLPAIVRALMRVSSSEDGTPKDPPSLPGQCSR